MAWGTIGLVLGIISVLIEFHRIECDGYDIIHRDRGENLSSSISLFGDDMSAKICTKGRRGMGNARITLGNHSGFG